MKRLASERIPETNTAISCAAATAHHSVLVRGPGYGLDSSLMFTKLDQRLVCVGSVPDEQLVVVASGGELLLVRAPLEPTHLLLVPFELGEEVIFHSEVAVQDALVP